MLIKHPLLRLWLCVAAATLSAPIAAAHVDPPGKDSGIVIHLFGAPAPDPAPVPPAAPAAGGSGTQATTAQASGPAQPRPWINPTGGDILREMFITGDPNQKPGANLPKGRLSDSAPKN